METINNLKKEFKVMEFVRQTRLEMNDLYLKDRQKYLDSLKNAMNDFKKTVQNTQHNSVLSM